MSDTKTRNAGLVIAGAILFVAAALNLFSGFQTLNDKSSLVEQIGWTNAAVNYFAWSALAFGVVEAVCAVLLLRRQREGIGVTYAVVPMAAVYWIADLSVRPGFAVAALIALAVVVVVVAISRDQFE